MSNQDCSIATIAAEIVDIETLETQKRDALHFHDLAVWNIKEALEATYKAGQESMSNKIANKVLAP